VLCSAASGMQGQLQTACIDCTRFSTGDGIGHVLALLSGALYLIIYSQALVGGPVGSWGTHAHQRAHLSHLCLHLDNNAYILFARETFHLMSPHRRSVGAAEGDKNA